MVKSDFWWITDQEKKDYIYVKLVHHAPLAESDSTASLFSNPDLVIVTAMEKWCANHGRINVYRALKVFKDKLATAGLSGPFILDIDNEKEDLNDALAVTREAVKHILTSFKVTENDIRVFFTGHKGFNIEVRPSAIGIIGSFEEQHSKVESRRREIIKELQKSKKLIAKGVGSYGENGKPICEISLKYAWHLKTYNVVSELGTLIDEIHEYVRLHNSINAWIEDKVTKSRNKVELSIKELESLTIEKIISKSEFQQP